MYNIKAKVTHTNNLTTLFIIKTNNRTQGEAKDYAVKVITGWENVKYFQIIEVSTRDMILNKYLVQIKLYYKNEKTRINKLTPKGETPEEAALLADEIIQAWPKWKQYEILNISEL
jgi:hypothetical protein